MRVVDDHRERLPLLHRLEPTRDAAHRLEPARDRGIVDPEQARSCERTERVLDVEAAAQLEVDAVERRGPDRSGGSEAERERLRQLRRQPPPVLVPEVDRRRRVPCDEEAPLRLEVRLHVAVEVEVVLAEVREDEDGEANAVEPVELRRVRRRLHRARAVAGVEHLAERALQVDRLRRRAHDTAPLAADTRLHGAEQPGLRPAAARIA